MFLRKSKFKPDYNNGIIIRSPNKIKKTKSIGKAEKIFDMPLRKSKFKPDYNNEIIIQSSNKRKKTKPIVEDEKIFRCCICYEYSNDIKYINCKKGGIQDKIPPFGKTNISCRDKTICYKCRDKLRNKCPYCNNHKLYKVINPFPKKKMCFIERLEKIEKKRRMKFNKEKDIDILFNILDCDDYF